MTDALGATETMLFGPFWPPYTGHIHAQSVASTLFGQSLRETVWKFGMSPGSGPLGPPGGCQEAADVLFLAQKTHGREAFQLFSKQFLRDCLENRIREGNDLRSRA